MYFYRLSAIIPLCLSLHLIFSIALNSPALYYTPDDHIAVNCGSSGNSTALDGRQWIGDIGSKYIISQGSKGKLISSTAIDQPLSPDPVPYKTVRISRWQFTYIFRVTPGQKFIRLHFYPTSYPGFKRSKAFFTVKAGPYTLLNNFSASLTADALGLQSFAKEFCVNVEENQPLIITFSPLLTCPLDEEVYAFVNGIEIVSMPTGLYHTRESDPGAHVVGKKYRFPMDQSIALEMVHRLNIGGSSILSVEDTGMFREWSGDSKYLLESRVLPFTMTVRIKYTTISRYTAPQKVYQTSWSMAPDKQANKPFNFTWKLPVDLGFRYLLRFHFCELEYETKDGRHMEFSIFINNQMAEVYADLFRWSWGNRVAVYKDYVVMMEGERMEGKRDLLITLCPHESHDEYEHMTDAILKGLEVFKLSNPDNNLAAGVNPRVSLPHASTSSNPNPRRKLVFASGGNATATGVVILITVLNIFVYQLRILGENFGEENHSSLQHEENNSSLLLEQPEENNLSFLPEGLCRRFSLAEIQSATNNFNDGLVTGSGGFGKVYKGLIDGGAAYVAIKRLNTKSQQGPNEFWTEIEMLSKLRHKHVVSLIGYCNEFQEMILVYDYMEQGTLADHLYSKGNGNTRRQLSWETWLNICIGAARGLNYLHKGAPLSVIHRDVKSTNILLDKDLVAKISDFGLSKMSNNHSDTHVTTDVKGTFGYLDPEYFYTRRLTKKTDVYAFGVVLLEVLCGRPAVDVWLEEEQQSLALWAQHCIKQGKLDQIIDPNLRDKISSHSLKVFVEVANKCLHNHRNERPSMANVVLSLECALTSLEYHCGDSSAEEEEDVVNDGGADDEQITLESQEYQYRDYSTDEEEEEEEEEDVVNDGRANDEQIDENIDDALPQGTVPFPSTQVQCEENIPQHKKKLKDKLNKVFQGSITLLTKGMAIRGRKKKNNGSKSGRLQWGTQLYRRFSIAEIREATNNFHNNLFIGEGGLSKVYKGWIDNRNLEIAIRRLKAPASAEMQAQSQLSHPHIMSLIGYCDDEGELILVYNYMVNGSLHNHLYRMHSGYDPLPWKKRLEICIGTARGLQYLHSGTTQTIIHNNVKPTKILLDENWVAKVSDFESKVVATGITAVISRVGTMGYLDPEYIYHLGLTEKSDVYSFGVVLLEVLCARKAYDSSLNEDQMLLVRWFRTNVRRKTVDQITDPYLVGKIAPECLREFVKIAWNCLLDRGRERPSMNDVVESLQIALQLQQTLHIDNDSVEEWSGSAVAHAYNNVLPYDNTFDNISSDTRQRQKKRKDRDSNTKRLQGESAAQLYRHFSISEIQAATDNFHDNLMVGEGDFSKVYKGRIDHGTLEVAIRQLKAPASDDSLRAEIQAQSQIRHPNILSLIGYCDDERQLVLVYNYMVNSSLHNYLYGMDGGSYGPLAWKRRLEICIGAARGLQYLHSGATNTIVHGNIKPRKILLDENWVAKVSDFQLFKVVPKRACGTRHKKPTKKSDVYSFGAVLLEVLCAMKQYDSSPNEDHMRLVAFFKTSVRSRTIGHIIDPYLVGRIAPECLRDFVKIVWNCLLDRESERPSMHAVVERLQIALQLQQTWQSDYEVEGASSHDDPMEEWYRSAFACAYNNVLLYDNAFDITIQYDFD